MLEDQFYVRILLNMAFGAMLVKAFYAMARYDNREVKPERHIALKAFGVFSAVLSCVFFVLFAVSLREVSFPSAMLEPLVTSHTIVRTSDTALVWGRPDRVQAVVLNCSLAVFYSMGVAVYLCLFRSSRSKWYVKIGKFLMGALLLIFYCSATALNYFDIYELVWPAAFIVMFVIIIRRKPKRAPAVAAQAEEPSGGAPAKPARVFAEDESDYAPKTAGSAPESGGASGRGDGEAEASAEYAEALLKEASAFDAADEAHEAPPAEKPDGGRGSGEPENRTRRLLKRAGAVVLAALVVSGLSYFLYKELVWDEDKIEKLAYEGNPDAQYLFALKFYENEDEARAAYWFLQAARQGHPAAQCKLAIAYHEGEGVSTDYEKALYWVRLSVENGDALAQLSLGDWYYEGLYRQDARYKGRHYDYNSYINDYDYINITFLPQNTDSAMYWWRKSAAQGNEDAKERLERIRE